jgi:PhnB protein
MVLLPTPAIRDYIRAQEENEINCSSMEQIETWFSKLSAGGKVGHPLKEEFWGSIFADLTDKFEMRWMLNWDKPK